MPKKRKRHPFHRLFTITRVGLGRNVVFLRCCSAWRLGNCILSHWQEVGSDNIFHVCIHSDDDVRLIPTMNLGSSCSILVGNKSCLMAITCSGQLYSWYKLDVFFCQSRPNHLPARRDMKTQRSFFPPLSVQPLLCSSPNCTIHEATVRPNGAPVIQCSTGIAHSYDPLLSSWITLSERWWSEGSDVWQGRQRGNSQSGSRGVLNSVESAIGTIDDASAAEKPRPAWWNTALTLGHLETRLHSARVLDSPQEYKQALLLYAKKISDEAFKGKAEELIRELYGPIYWCVAWAFFLEGFICI